MGKPGTPERGRGRGRGQSCRTAGGRGHPFRTRLSPGAAEHLDSSWDRGDLWIAGLLCCFPSITVSMVIKVFVATSSGSTAVGGSFNFLLLLLGSGWGISLGDARKQPARDKKPTGILSRNKLQFYSALTTLFLKAAQGVENSCRCRLACLRAFTTVLTFTSK